MGRFCVILAVAALFAGCGNAERRLENHLSSLRQGDVFSLDTMYGRRFDSVCVVPCYPSMDRLKWLNRWQKKHLSLALSYDGRSGLLFVRDGKLVGKCLLTDPGAVNFGLLRDEEPRDTLLGADTKYIITDSTDKSTNGPRVVKICERDRIENATVTDNN